MKKRFTIETKDGSKTIHIPEWNESYHSKHGAIQEAMHVFIRNGLDYFTDYVSVNILELGFGTGLNALITLIESEFRNKNIHYTGVEKFPISKQEWSDLNYVSKLKNYYKELSLSNLEMTASLIHENSWKETHQYSEYFNLIKIQKDFFDLNQLESNQFDLVYFDCFGARVQPELWTESLFKIVYNLMKPNGILTTYSAKGSARRAMESVGFKVERKPGPPGKREMLVAIK